MQKIAIGALALLTLALAATNARHQNRERLLEERLAAAERKSKRKPAAAPPVERAPDPVADVPAPVFAPAPAPAPEAPVPASVTLQEKINPPYLRLNTASLEWPAASFSSQVDMLSSGIVFASSETDLNLSEPQRAAIERLREVQRAQSQEVEQAIRNLLTPEQQARYDSSRNVQHLWIGKTDVTEPLNLNGLRGGYLGVSGGDASGGGAEVTNVLPNTAASAAGLQNGDVILEVNGESIAGLSALSETIRKTGEGFAATLRIRRAGVEFIQGVQLGGASK